MARAKKGTISVQIDKVAMKKALQLAAHLPDRLREKALKKGIREASKLMGMTTRGYITQPGYFGDKDQGEHPPLSKNIKWVVRSKKQYVSGFVGADYKKAPHFHLYDQGHRMVTHKPAKRFVGNVRGKQDLKRAADDTKSRQGRLLVDAMVKFVKFRQFQ